tara:strand:+ start:2474 stop:2806 length:333 start_codon:yes stop_codon:yes gene_type:complete
MKYEKGDLIAVKTLEEKRVTCIIVATFNEGQFSYCYTVDSGRYRLVYTREIEFIISKGFDVNFATTSEDYEIDYSFYEACAHAYAYTPYFGYPFCPDTDSDEEDPDEDEE